MRELIYAIAQLIDIAGVLGDYEPREDLQAIADDWQQVGNDLRSVIGGR